MRNILILSILVLCFSCKKESTVNSADTGDPKGGSANAALGTVYYVDGAAGNDSNDGLSLTTAWKTIQKSFNTAVAGSTVMIKGGTYYEQLTVKVSGTAGSPVTFTNYNGEQVIIDGSKNSGTTIVTIADKTNF